MPKEGRPGLYWSTYIVRENMMQYSELHFKGEPVDRILRLAKENEGDLESVANQLNRDVVQEDPLFVSSTELVDVIKWTEQNDHETKIRVL